MSAVPPTRERTQTARPDKEGKPSFDWTLTSSSITDTVRLIAGPLNVLPVIFVPGIMGSNLKSIEKGEQVWRLDAVKGEPAGLAASYVGLGPGPRQRRLHPDRCVVDDQGAIPKQIRGSVHNREDYRRRGWGTVSEASYHAFLLWLEEHLNPVGRNPARWLDYYQDQATISAPPQAGAEPKLFPGIRMGIKGQPFGAQAAFEPIMTDDLLARSKFYMPVYAAGYNWLASNDDAASLLRDRIIEIIKEHDRGVYRCEQVIVVTHSMGGLVARACAQLQGMNESIAGIVHGVMPAVGAAVAYRRCKVGMSDEMGWIPAMTLGASGKEVTAVFAQAPGALQLLPSQSYPANWLQIKKPDGTIDIPATGDPYEEIYKRRDRWWGLVNEAWLSPVGGKPIKWADYVDNVNEARKFHTSLARNYHRNTYVYYGADKDQKSFGKVTWRIASGMAPDSKPRPSLSAVEGMTSEQVRLGGSTPEHVGGQTEIVPNYSGMGGGGVTMIESSYWELHCEHQDGAGDGTVPVASGAAPIREGGANIRQQFKMTGFDHEGSYKNTDTQRATLYAITRISGGAKRPA